MKSINQYIQEKFELNKNTKVSLGNEYTFNGFKKLISSELHTTENINDDIFKHMISVLFNNDKSKLKNISFINVSKDKEEIDFFKKQIIPKDRDISYFKSAYYIDSENKLPVFHYYNVSKKTGYPNMNIYQYRIGYNIGKDIFDISTIRLFKINI